MFLRGLQVRGYFWVVTCKRCEQVIKLDSAGVTVDERIGGRYKPHVAVLCPRCKAKFRYTQSEVWKQKVYAR